MSQHQSDPGVFEEPQKTFFQASGGLPCTFLLALKSALEPLAPKLARVCLRYTGCFFLSSWSVDVRNSGPPPKNMKTLLILALGLLAVAKATPGETVVDDMVIIEGKFSQFYRILGPTYISLIWR